MLSLVGVITVIRTIFPTTEVNDAIGYIELLMIACNTSCVFVGIRRYRPTHKYLWMLSALSPTLLVGGMMIGSFEPASADLSPEAQLSDYVQMLGFLPILVFLAKVNRLRSSGGGSDRAGLLDASMIGIAFFLVMWTFTVGPNLEESNSSFGVIINILAYPVAELSLAWLIARITFGGARTIPLRGFLLAGATMAVADTFYSWYQLNHEVTPLVYGWINSVYDLAYFAFFVGFLHPDIATLTDPTNKKPSLGGRARLTMTSIAALMAPVLILMQDKIFDGPITVLAVGAIAMFVLVVLRLEGMLRYQEKTSRELDNSLRQVQLADMQLRHAQKMEAIGKLSAGMAHEINTPIQFINSNIYFLQESFQTLVDVADVERLEDRSNLDLLVEEVPNAISDTLDGIGRVASIVAAMKEFGDADSGQTRAVDINHALVNVLTVAHSRIEPVADVVQEFHDVPGVEGYARDINDALLQMLINAAQALESSGADNEQRGEITLRSWTEDDSVYFSVSDNGVGIPEDIRYRIFEPFFTTRQVGDGTGQGLAVVWNVFVERHGGSITVDSVVGEGTTFTVRLPLTLSRA